MIEMANIELLPPKLKVDINTQLRLRVLAGVLYELTEICGAHIEDDLSKGIIERDIIKEIDISFKDSNGKIQGGIEFLIDWEKFEFLIKTSGGTEAYKGISFSNGYCNALDKKMLKVLQVHVEKLKKAYDISSVICTFCYRNKYIRTEDIHNATRQFMGHVKAKEKNIATNKQFAKSLEAVFQGLEGILKVKLKL